MATVNVLRFVCFSRFHILDAGVSDRVVVVSSSAAAVFLCTCILLTVFLVRWNSSRGWLSDTVSSMNPYCVVSVHCIDCMTCD